MNLERVAEVVAEYKTLNDIERGQFIRLHYSPPKPRFEGMDAATKAKWDESRNWKIFTPEEIGDRQMNLARVEEVIAKYDALTDEEQFEFVKRKAAIDCPPREN